MQLISEKFVSITARLEDAKAGTSTRQVGRFTLLAWPGAIRCDGLVPKAIRIFHFEKATTLWSSAHTTGRGRCGR